MAEPPGDSLPLFAPAARPLTVTQLNNQARLLLERNFARVQVLGEVSNHKLVSGNHYFSLRDRDAQLPCALFKREASRFGGLLADGVQLVAHGRLTIYGAYGRYQMVVDKLEQRGAGALQQAFDELKARLLREGLFAAEIKRPLPELPRAVAVVTSPTGAVIRDIVHVALRRFPAAHLIVVPTRVQGAEAAPEIVRAIQQADALAGRGLIDVVIVARGGGSLEDLWGFNDERVARAIRATRVPVVSAVGHETDFSIADFVADVRAPTPSAAAELVFPERAALGQAVLRPMRRIERAVRQELRQKRLELRGLVARLGDGSVILRESRQRLNLLEQRSTHALETHLGRGRRRLSHAEARLLRQQPRTHLRELGAELRAAAARLDVAMKHRLLRERSRLGDVEGRLTALSPLAVLERGYAIALAPDGRAVRDPSQVNAGDALDVRVAKGRIAAQVVSR